jgi:hypothetical protein
VFKKFNPELPICLKHGCKSRQWAKKNPNVAFKNLRFGQLFGGITGDYAVSGFEMMLQGVLLNFILNKKDETIIKNINFDVSFGVPGYPR